MGLLPGRLRSVSRERLGDDVELITIVLSYELYLGKADNNLGDLRRELELYTAQLIAMSGHASLPANECRFPKHDVSLAEHTKLHLDGEPTVNQSLHLDNRRPT